MSRIVLLITLSLALAACATMQDSGRQSPASQAISSDDFLDYQPIAPLPALNVRYYNRVTKTYEDKPWASFPDDAAGRNLKKSLLPMQSSYTYVIKDDSSGTLSLLANTASIAKGNYTVVSDYILYRVENVPGAGVGLVGVGMRVRAKIRTNKGGLNLSGLFNLALEAKAENLSGELQVDVIGIYSKDVVQIFPAMTTEISPTSIQQVMQALAAIKAKISEDNVDITPQLIALRQNQKGAKSIIEDSLANAQGAKIGSEQSSRIEAIVSYVGTDKARWEAIVQASGLDKQQKQAWSGIPTQQIGKRLRIEAGATTYGVFPKLYDAYLKIK
ncbi:MAG TPA: hypothetical protein VNI58_10710 [Mariprofundaceae bacterium]|nr:hypothetical protein [Mariprofundaceae bacterium]